MTEVFSLVLALVGVTALMLGVLYLMKRALTRVSGNKSDKGMSVISCLGVGQDRQLAAVKAGNKYLLLGISGAGINLLCELSEEDIEIIRSAGISAAPAKSFSEFLSERMHREDTPPEDDDKDSTL